jgi:hypothetical protein
MPNPVDEAPAGHGPVALPLDPSDSQPNDRARLRKFRRRAFYVFVVCLTLGLVMVWEHPPAVGHPIEELSHAAVGIADDPRLEVCAVLPSETRSSRLTFQRYQNPEDAEYCTEWTPVTESGTGHHLASASFELPTGAKLLFFLSRGPLSGHINFIKTPGYSAGPIEVNLTAQYHHSEDLKRTKVCRMGPLSDHGVLVWVSIIAFI